MICKIYDNLLEPHVAELIDAEIRNVYWKYDYNSNKKIGIQPHWHHLCGHDEEGVIANNLVIFCLYGQLQHINCN